MEAVDLEFAAAGGNRDPAAADWFVNDGVQILAYGAGRNVALWQQSPKNGRGLTLLKGHTGDIKAVKCLDLGDGEAKFLLSGSADTTIRLWKFSAVVSSTVITDAHTSSVNHLGCTSGLRRFVSASADSSVVVWALNDNSSTDDIACTAIDRIRLGFIPLTAELAALDSESWTLAVGGTKSQIELYISSTREIALDETTTPPPGKFQHVASLSGHEGWIRSLAFQSECEDDSGDLFLASASQDKYIRLWRISKTKAKPARSADAATKIGELLSTPSSLAGKTYRFDSANGNHYSVSFDALLVGHEDWIYTVAWARWKGNLQLLSASADNSVCIWEAESSSDLWTSIARLGEVSAQKGATTATGSTGGLWIGLWSPSGAEIAGLGRTGGWRLWQRDKSETWVQSTGPTGHIKEIRSLAWSKEGHYLLTTGADQTTRLFAQQQKDRQWYEYSRAQIHGYDLNCVDVVSETQFVSGADEKLLRVFDLPAIVARLLSTQCGIQQLKPESLPGAASLAVLGLSNKAVDGHAQGTAPMMENFEDNIDKKSAETSQSVLDIGEPPLEDDLARHTLWPEKEKLYGHGYEISTVSASHDGSIIATACRASALTHAVVRLYSTVDWNEIKPVLQAHTLTVHSLRFSPDDKYLLSVGRDRQWTVFEREAASSKIFLQKAIESKAHARMIMDCAWSPSTDQRVFATVGRDKALKLWRLNGTSATCEATFSAESPFTAVDFLPYTGSSTNREYAVAAGTDVGDITVYRVRQDQFTAVRKIEVPMSMSPASGVTRLSWRPFRRPVHERELEKHYLAVASEDGAVRIYVYAAA